MTGAGRAVSPRASPHRAPPRPVGRCPFFSGTEIRLGGGWRRCASPRPGRALGAFIGGASRPFTARRLGLPDYPHRNCFGHPPVRTTKAPPPSLPVAQAIQQTARAQIDADPTIPIPLHASERTIPPPHCCTLSEGPYVPPNNMPLRVTMNGHAVRSYSARIVSCVVGSECGEARDIRFWRSGIVAMRPLLAGTEGHWGVAWRFSLRPLDPQPSVPEKPSGLAAELAISAILAAFVRTALAAQGRLLLRAVIRPRCTPKGCRVFFPSETKSLSVRAPGPREWIHRHRPKTSGP